MTLKTQHFLIGLCVGFMFAGIGAYWATGNGYMLVISGAGIVIVIMANIVKIK